MLFVKAWSKFHWVFVNQLRRAMKRSKYGPRSDLASFCYQRTKLLLEYAKYGDGTTLLLERHLRRSLPTRVYLQRRWYPTHDPFRALTPFYGLFIFRTIIRVLTCILYIQLALLYKLDKLDNIIYTISLYSFSILE